MHRIPGLQDLPWSAWERLQAAAKPEYREQRSARQRVRLPPRERLALLPHHSSTAAGIRRLQRRRSSPKLRCCNRHRRGRWTQLRSWHHPAKCHHFRQTTLHTQYRRLSGVYQFQPTGHRCRGFRPRRHHKCRNRYTVCRPLRPRRIVLVRPRYLARGSLILISIAAALSCQARIVGSWNGSLSQV